MSDYYKMRSGGVVYPASYVDDPSSSGVIPVVVIDPEDREQVERLRDLTGYYSAQALAEALRSLIAPPKPPEPQGLGAVVEDADGKRWVRFDPDPGRLGSGFCWAAPSPGAYSRVVWDEVAAVRVLSPGWSE